MGKGSEFTERLFVQGEVCITWLKHVLGATSDNSGGKFKKEKKKYSRAVTGLGKATHVSGSQPLRS